MASHETPTDKGFLPYTGLNFRELYILGQTYCFSSQPEGRRPLGAEMQCSLVVLRRQGSVCSSLLWQRRAGCAQLERAEFVQQQLSSQSPEVLDKVEAFVALPQLLSVRYDGILSGAPSCTASVRQHPEAFPLFCAIEPGYGKQLQVEPSWFCLIFPF